MTEKLFVDINGTQQGMFLQSENPEKPVLLFLHGGPGSPEIAFTAKYPTGLEKLFTVCWWEQRGSGLSYSRNITPEEMTIDQMIADTLVVTRYLQQRFGKEKIYLMGHSWGSLLGVLAIQQAPHLFHAYIGIGQVTRQQESERLAYAYMLEAFQKAKNKRMVRKLERFAVDKGGEISVAYLGARSEGMMKLGIGVMRHLTSMLACVLIILRFKGYTAAEKANFPKGGALSLKALWGFVLKTDLFEQVPEVKVPFYIFHGEYDYQVSYTLARAFAAAVHAPVKGFYTFKQSAHSPCFEEPEKMCHILRTDVLHAAANLADDSAAT